MLVKPQNLRRLPTKWEELTKFQEENQQNDEATQQNEEAHLNEGQTEPHVEDEEIDQL